MVPLYSPGKNTLDWVQVDWKSKGEKCQICKNTYFHSKINQNIVVSNGMKHMIKKFYLHEKKKSFIDGKMVKHQEFWIKTTNKFLRDVLLLQDTDIYILPKSQPIEGCPPIERKNMVLCPAIARYPLIEGCPPKSLCSRTAKMQI